MANTPKSGLHQALTATNDVLTGYKTMLERAEPEIVPILTDLTSMHKRYASALEQRLNALGDTGEDDSSLRGTMNAVVVTLRDWVADLDEGSLDAVQRGEQALMDIYDDAVSDWSATDDGVTAALLNRQYQEIGEQVDHLEDHHQCPIFGGSSNQA